MDENISILKSEYLILNEVKSKNIEIPSFENKTIVLDNLDSDLDIKVLKGANLKLEKLSFKDLNLTINIQIEEDASVDLISISNNKLLENINIYLVGLNAKFNQKTLCITKGFNEVINTKVYHKEKNTYSNVENYGIALDNSNITFNTTGSILKGCAKSNCKQLSRGMIVGEKASIKSFPILLIDEFDVLANHGAAIGKLSDDELFYLMSRGLTSNEAFMLILKGIIDPIVDSLTEDKVKEYVKNEINKNM